jgi:hypothetical protein
MYKPGDRPVDKSDGKTIEKPVQELADTKDDEDFVQTKSILAANTTTSVKQP